MLGYKIGWRIKIWRTTDPVEKLNEHERNFIDYQLNTVANEFNISVLFLI